jgi:AmiR/NasT family two-component response regulator
VGVLIAPVLGDRVSPQIAGELVDSLRRRQSQRIAEQLEVALQSRIVIEQAKGIIAAERRISVDQAFDLLRNHARRHNADLRTTADAVVRLGLRP